MIRTPMSMMVRRSLSRCKREDRESGKRMSRMPIYDKDYPEFRIALRGKCWYVQQKMGANGTRERDCWHDISRGIEIEDDARRALSAKAVGGAKRKLEDDAFKRRVAEMFDTKVQW